MQVLASQLHFLANKNAELAIPPLFWPVNCIKIGGHVALLSDPTVYSLYCGFSPYDGVLKRRTNQNSFVLKHKHIPPYSLIHSRDFILETLCI